MRDTFTDRMIIHQHRMVSGYNHYWSDNTNPHPPKGIWYASGYYRYINKHALLDRFKQHSSKEIFFHGHTPEDCFSQVPDPASPTGIRVDTFFLRKGTPPSYALKRLEEDLCLLDCGTFCTISAYKALCDILTKEKFDYLFAADSPYPLTLIKGESSPLSKILIKQEINKENEARKGDLCYFSNIKEYIAKHPAGTSRGYHVLCSRENPHRYIGHGLGVLSGSIELDKQEIEKELLDCYNSEPVDEGFLTEKLWDYYYSFYFRGDKKKGKNLVASYRDKQMTIEQFRNELPRIHLSGKRHEGKMGLWVHRPHLGRIQALIDAPLNSVRNVFADFSKIPEKSLPSPH